MTGTLLDCAGGGARAGFGVTASYGVSHDSRVFGAVLVRVAAVVSAVRDTAAP